MNDFKKIFERPLTKPQKHCALYAKGHYDQNESLRDDLRVIYSMNKNGVLTSDSRLFENLVHPTLIKLKGPEQFSETAGRWLSDVLTLNPNLRPDNIFEAYMSQIAMTKTGPMSVLNDVTPKRIDHDSLPSIEPSN